MKAPRFPLVLLCLSCLGTLALAQTGSIKGRVTRDDGSPFPGVLVEVEGGVVKRRGPVRREADELVRDLAPKRK